MLLLRRARTTVLCAALGVFAWHAVERSWLAVALAFVAGVELAWLAALVRPSSCERLRLQPP